MKTINSKGVILSDKAVQMTKQSPVSISVKGIVISRKIMVKRKGRYKK